MSTSPSSSTAEPCTPSSPFRDKIDELDQGSKKQDVEDKKIQLGAITKIGGEVQQAEAKYKQDYEGLVFANTQSTAYVTSREAQIIAQVPQGDRAAIERVATCAVENVASLKKAWIEARAKLPELQKAHAQKQIALVDAEEPYRAALDFRSGQADLDAATTQATKLIDAKNFRGAYFLVAVDMKGRLKAPVKPADYNKALEAEALKYFTAFEEARQAKAALDQTVADAQKKKKDYEDAENKLREATLKQIAEEPPVSAGIGTGGGTGTATGKGTGAGTGGGTAAAPPAAGATSTGSATAG